MPKTGFSVLLCVGLLAGLGRPASAQGATDRLIESQRAMLDAIRQLQTSQATELRNTRFATTQTRDTVARLARTIDSLRAALEIDKRADSLRALVALQARQLDSLREAGAELRQLVQRLVSDTTRLASGVALLKADRDRLADSVSQLTVAAALANDRLTTAAKRNADLLAQLQQQYQELLSRMPEKKQP